ncbi:glycosyltransferase family 2 protein [Chloroflexota bacterium]
MYRQGRRLYPQELLKVSLAVPPIMEVGSSDSLPEPSVTIVVLSLERIHLTRRTINSIYYNTYYPFNVLVFDNGSSLSTISELQNLAADHDNMQVYYNSTNLGAAGGRNQAFSMVKSEYVVSFDNDIICHPGWLRETMKCAVMYQSDFVAPLRLDVSSKVWSHGSELIYTSNGEVIEIARWFHDLPLDFVQSLFTKKTFSTNFLPGGAGLFNIEAFTCCGGFDPAFEHFEDIDFSLRLTKNGYSVCTTPHAQLTHDDAWIPNSQLDIEYAKEHYDLSKLYKAAARFKLIWGVDVFPQKYVLAFRDRLNSKLGAQSSG